MLPSEFHNKRILISALNWGMGHVSRCIPLVSLLLKNNNTLFVAGDDSQIEIFRQYFPELTFIQHIGYPFKFQGKGNFSLDLFKQMVPLKNRLKKELLEVDEMVNKFNVDLIISDHRYGFQSDKVQSIILTHQLNLPLKWYEGWVQKIHTGCLKKFSEIWVPDTLNSDYAGKLSMNTSGLKVEYIGALSRFSLYNVSKEPYIERVFIASGPLVYAKKFLEEQFRTKRNGETKSVIIAARSVLENQSDEKFDLQSSDDWKTCDQLILNSKSIVARCGYSTLMDLIVLKKHFEITPTPGQREQEYLFQLWTQKVQERSLTQ